MRQLMLHWPDDIDQEALSRLSDALVPDVKGLTAEEIATRAVGADQQAQFLFGHLVQALRGLDGGDRLEVRHSGLENILSQPEFGGDEAQSVLEMVRGGAFLSAVLPQLGEGREVQVFIGDENPTHALRRFGVVLATYGVDGEVTGVLGVLGPTRMSYWRSISSVRYMARLMSDLMADLYPS